MNIKEQELIINAINDLNISKDAKRINCAIIKLAGVDLNRTIRMLVENSLDFEALEELDEELEKSPDELDADFVDFLLDEISYKRSVEDEIKDMDIESEKQEIINQKKILSKIFDKLSNRPNFDDK